MSRRHPLAAVQPPHHLARALAVDGEAHQLARGIVHLQRVVTLARRYNSGYTDFMKTAISLPDGLYSAADSLAGRLGVSRSELYATALAEFVAKHSEAEITARLDRLYEGEACGLDSVLHDVQRQSLGSDRW